MDKELSGRPDDAHVLREALDNQGKLMQQLCEELDEEREASSTAASAAMSMILRLQAEKAAVAMEARQYRRMAEEKMQYAQESLVVFEQLMYRRELEIKALEFQVQAFKHKLLSVGADDFDVEKLEELNEQSSGHRGHRGKVLISVWQEEEEEKEEDEEEEDDGHSIKMTKMKRNLHLPAMKTKSSNSSSSSYPQSGKQSNNGGSSNKMKPPHPWSSIKHLAIKEEGDEILEVRCEDEVEEDHKIRKDRAIHERSRLNSETNTLSFNSLSRFSSFHSAICNDEDIECGNHPELVRSGCSFISCQSEDGLYLSELDPHFFCPGSENETVTNNNSGVYDVLEVLKYPEGDNENCEKLPDKKMDEEDRLKKPNIPQQHKSKEHLIHEEKASMLSVSELYGAQTQLNMRMKQLEDERERMKQEDAQRTLEEFKLLKDIYERLDTIQTQMKNHRCEKQNSRTDSSCIMSMMEAILHCSL